MSLVLATTTATSTTPTTTTIRSWWVCGGSSNTSLKRFLFYKESLKKRFFVKREKRVFMARVEHLIIHRKTKCFLREVFSECSKFPKSQRFILNKYIQESSLRILDYVVLINSSSEKKKYFLQAELELTRLRSFFEIACDLRFLSRQRYAFFRGSIDEIGRMFGGWRRSLHITLT